MKGLPGRRWIALLIVTLVALDWATKFWVINRLALGETQSIVDGWLYFVHRQNPGVAFSFLSDLPYGWRIPILGGLSMIGIILFSRIVASTSDQIARYAGAAVIAGAVGNLGDRLLTGEVTDFVLLSFFPFVFNLADTAITIGGALLALRLAMDQSAPTAKPSLG